MAVASLIVFGVWYALLGLVPLLPQPLPPLIIWGVVFVLMVFAYHVEYLRTHFIK